MIQKFAHQTSDALHDLFQIANDVLHGQATPVTEATDEQRPNTMCKHIAGTAIVADKRCNILLRLPKKGQRQTAQIRSAPRRFENPLRPSAKGPAAQSHTLTAAQRYTWRRWPRCAYLATPVVNDNGTFARQHRQNFPLHICRQHMHVALNLIVENWIVGQVPMHHVVFKNVEWLQAHNHAMKPHVEGQCLRGETLRVHEFTRACVLLVVLPRSYNLVLALDVVAEEVSVVNYPLLDECIHSSHSH